MKFVLVQPETQFQMSKINIFMFLFSFGPILSTPSYIQYKMNQATLMINSRAWYAAPLYDAQCTSDNGLLLLARMAAAIGTQSDIDRVSHFLSSPAHNMYAAPVHCTAVDCNF